MNLHNLKEQFLSLINKNDISSLEYNLLYWLENKEFLTDELEDSDIYSGLENYLDQDTMNFWEFYCTEKTIVIYADFIENPYIKLIFEKKLNTIDSSVTIAEKKITINNYLFKVISKELHKNINNQNCKLDDDMKKIIESYSDNYELNGIISYDNGYFNISAYKESSFQNKDIYLNKLSIIQNSLQISFLCLSLYSANTYSQEEVQHDATEITKKALLETEAGKQIINNIKKTTKKTVDNIENSYPESKIPMTLVGLGINSLTDNGIAIKNKNNIIFDNTQYELLIKDEIQFRMKGKNPMNEKSDYTFSASSEKVELEFNFNIDW